LSCCSLVLILACRLTRQMLFLIDLGVYEEERTGQAAKTLYIHTRVHLLSFPPSLDSVLKKVVHKIGVLLL